MARFNITGEFEKFDAELGLALGWAIICTKGGEPYFDLQDDHIPDDSMLKAATDFMVHSQVGKEMHNGKSIAKVVFAWPLTAEIAKAFDIKTEKTGLMIAFKPESQEVIDKFKSGEYTGFSIGGERLEDEEVD